MDASLHRWAPGLHFLLALLAIPVAAQPVIEDYEGWTITVISGDTVRVLDGSNRVHTVRLKGIDAPEKGQPFAEDSRKRLASLLIGKEIEVDVGKQDDFGTTVAKIWVQPPDCKKCKKTLDVNHAQVLAGLAWWASKYADEQSREDRGRYQSAQEEARKRGLGLWSEPDPVPPWTWSAREGAEQ